MTSDKKNPPLWIGTKIIIIVCIVLGVLGVIRIYGIRQIYDTHGYPTNLVQMIKEENPTNQEIFKWFINSSEQEITKEIKWCLSENIITTYTINGMERYRITPFGEHELLGWELTA